MPIDERPAGRERGEMTSVKEAADRNRSQIDQIDVGLRLERRQPGWIKRQHKARRALAEAEKERLGRIDKTLRLRGIEQRIMAGGSFLQHDSLADQIEAACRIACERRKRGRVGA